MENKLPRRKFLQLSSIALGSLAFGLESSLLLGNNPESATANDRSTIFVDVDSMAFFNAPARRKAVDLGGLKEKIPMHWPIRQEVSYYLAPESRQYFKSGPGDEPVVVAVVSECILFCAYNQGNDGSIISSGAYHAMTLKPANELRQGMEEFLQTIKAGKEPNSRNPERLVLKASGRYGREDQEEVIRSIEGVLRREGIYLRKLELEERNISMINKFYPDTGLLTTEKMKL